MTVERRRRLFGAADVFLRWYSLFPTLPAD
jgi:hypothetical protein